MFKLCRKLAARPSQYILTRTTNKIINKTRPFSSLVATMPSNLQLADMKVLEKPQELNIKPIEYLFPTLDIIRNVNILLWHQPGLNSDIIFSLDPTIFGMAIRKDIVLECIRYIRHKHRQPKKTKTKGEVRGSNKKPWPQKGQGRAQFGHRRNAIWRGGHKAHGPVLRSYAIDMNKKMRAQAMMIALAAKYREGNLIVVDNLNMEV